MYKYNLLLTVIIFAVFAISPAAGEPFGLKDTTSTGALHNNRHALGISVGNTSAAGLSYRYWPRKNGVQLTTLVLIEPGLSFIISGASYQRLLYEHRIASLYMQLNSHIEHQAGRLKPKGVKTWLMHAGAGPALNFHIGEVLSVNMMVGLGWFDILQTYYPNFHLAAEVGVFYWF